MERKGGRREREIPCLIPYLRYDFEFWERKKKRWKEEEKQESNIDRRGQDELGKEQGRIHDSIYDIYKSHVGGQGQ